MKKGEYLMEFNNILLNTMNSINLDIKIKLHNLVSSFKEEINNNVVEQPQEPSYYVEFVASIAEDADTKAFDAATPKTYWVEGEAISINGKKFEVKEVLENGNAIFENTEENALIRRTKSVNPTNTIIPKYLSSKL